MSLNLEAQCLASWFSSQENSWIFDISCQDLSNYSWQGSQDIAIFFKMVGKNQMKILEFLATKAKITKILAGETREFRIKVAQDLLISCNELSLKTQKLGFICVCFYQNLNVA